MVSSGVSENTPEDFSPAEQEVGSGSLSQQISAQLKRMTPSQN